MLKLSTKLFLLLLVLAATYLSSCSPTPQKDCGFVQNIYGQRIAWKTSAPVKIYIHESVPPELRPALYRAAATWEKEIGHKVFDFSEDSSGLSGTPARDQKNVIYFLSDWESDRSSEQGRTSVYWAGDQIQEADIRINGSNFSYYDQDMSVLVGSNSLKKQGIVVHDGYSFEALLLHELGHLLGLKHRVDGSA
ncbi:MAG: matrixin family metalloprotease, partial [Pseudobdellovibrio sp.]